MASPPKLPAGAGQPGNIRPSTFWVSGDLPKQWEADSAEPNVDLRFPESVVVFDQMARTDGQVGAILRAAVQSIQSARWTFADSPEVPAETVEFCRSEIGLPEHGQTLPSTRFSRVNFREHVRQALSFLTFGFAVFEQIYEVEPVGPAGTPVVHLADLASRPQRTIMHFLTDRDGNLSAVVQKALPEFARGTNWGGIELPAENLVLYSHEREGADWAGTSMLRTAYKHWLVKDVLLRLCGQIVERNGMGVPVLEYDGQAMTQSEAVAFAQQFRAGATAGGALPTGVKLTLVGVTGATYDPLPLMKYQDEAIANSALAMFMTLGHDTGARSLGETFKDFYDGSLQAIADELAEVVTERVIRPLVALNFGADAPYPRLVAGDMKANGTLEAKDLHLLVQVDAIRPDDKLEAFLRTSVGLPEADPDTARAAPLSPGTVIGPDGAPVEQPGSGGDVAGPTNPPYQGVDPNAPWEERINQPIPSMNAQFAERAAALLARVQALAGV